MTNREKCKKSMHEYVESLDDSGIYEFILENELTGKNIYSCGDCESEYGCCDCDDKIGVCEERFLAWINN